jgi:hypothetical protein
MARPVTPADLAADRALLAARVRSLDRALAELTDGPGPFVLVRDDGATYAGRWAHYSHDAPPRLYAYRGAAEKRASRDGTAVWPLRVWQATTQTTETTEGNR